MRAPSPVKAPPTKHRQPETSTVTVTDEVSQLCHIVVWQQMKEIDPVELRSKLTLRRLADKVGWEGGILAAMDYGIRSENIDDAQIAALWAQLELLYDQMMPIMSQLDLRIRQARAA